MGFSKHNHTFEDRWIVSEDERKPDRYPELYNLSARFLFQFLPRPAEVLRPEFLYVPFSTSNRKSLELRALISQWNTAWEAAQLRSVTMFEANDADFLKAQLPLISSIENRNVYLLPDTNKRFDAYTPLFAMLPIHTLNRFGLPPVRRPLWPNLGLGLTRDLEHSLPPNFRELLSTAFAAHVWPHLAPGSRIGAFSRFEPLRLLAHNLDFWLPHATRVIEDRLREMDFVDYEDDDEQQLVEYGKSVPAGAPVVVGRCRMGGHVWFGEQGARSATAEMVNLADKNDRLKAVIDSIRSNRVEEDFSERWSYAREDFERKLYKKRSRVRVKFVELSEAEGVMGPDSEIDDAMLWQDFLSLLDVNERQIVVCIRNSPTGLKDVAQQLGYANHSPVSKALARIRRKAAKLLES